MDYFEYRDGVLHAEDVPVPLLAERIGTPFYVYSQRTIERHLDVFAEGFLGTDYLVAFAVKALSNISVLRLMADKGCGADIVSSGEMHRALRAGIPADRIVFSGVGKTAAELSEALEAGVGQINVESVEELCDLSEIAVARGISAPVSLRINPSVDAKTHDKISTGRPDDKFGIPYASAEQAFCLARDLPGISVRGIAMHIGSQITSLAPVEAATAAIVALFRKLNSRGFALSTIDVGGGLGIPYGVSDPDPPPPQAYARCLRRMTEGLGATLIMEPGRLIVGNAGVLVTQIIRTKKQATRQFAIVDAGMNDLVRPALYGAEHRIIPIDNSSTEQSPFDIAGPVCESTDVFARNVPLGAVGAGDLLAMRTAGAYGAVQSSQYNTRPLIPEVLVEGSEFRLIRRRPTFEEMIALEEERASQS